MSAESPRHSRTGGPLKVPSQPPSDRSIIDAVSGFINDVTLSSSSNVDPKDVIQWARFETADINEPTPEGDGDHDISPLLLILGYGSGVQVWLIPPNGEAQEVLSWRQGTVRVLRILPTPQHGDCFVSKRPLIALCDSASPGPTFCSLSFISIRGGEQVKSIKFKNPILDVLANKRSIVVSFSERFAVFDAATLEDRMTVTTCYPCPCPLGGNMLMNPLALGDRWLAYADRKVNQSKRSSGGCEGEGVTSYTATVLHAAKSLSKGLRGLGESVAQSLAGGRSTSQSPSPPNTDMQQPGVVTIIDIEGSDEEESQDSDEQCDPIVAHFVAHSEAIIALKFDASGMLLVTADRRGHDFHVFRINPHPCGPSLASVHHLYILHRGDTTAKVQDIAISPDSRWAAISTLRGTTHVFAISPYGGGCGVRTHTQPRVVNRLSRFHRSAGLPIHAHTHAQPPPKRSSGSPVGDGLSVGSWFPNPRLPPYPLPTTSAPLAQLRPTANLPTHTITRTSSGRQRLSSLSEDSTSAPLLARAIFGQAGGGTVVPRGAPAPITALYLMTANGTLLHLVLYARPLSGVPKEKICDESPIELQVEGIAQWQLQRPAAAADLLAPLPPANPLLRPHLGAKCADICMNEEERWLSQVEIVTHAGPHRRLWMGPQFVFKTYNCTGSSSSLSEAETVEVDTSAAHGVARSNPVNMPGVRPIVPVLIESGSASSLEHSPSDSFRRRSLLSESGRAASLCDVQLKEDLAEAMKEDHGWREERRGVESAGVLIRAVDPLGCVVQTRPGAPPPPLDADDYTRENRDEATFRPVVRAPASLPPAALLLRPLPRTTTIPVQPLPPAPAPTPPPHPLPLDTGRLIPAALGVCPDDDIPDRVRTLPRPSDIQSAPLDEPPTRTSLGISSGDDSCKVSEYDRTCDVTPSVHGGDVSVSDKEVPADVCVSEKVCCDSSYVAERVGEFIEPNCEGSDSVKSASTRPDKSLNFRSDADNDIAEILSRSATSGTKLDKKLNENEGKSPLSKSNNSKEGKSIKREKTRNSEGQLDDTTTVNNEVLLSKSTSANRAESTVSSPIQSTIPTDSKSSTHKPILSSKRKSKESSPFSDESNKPIERLSGNLPCASQTDIASYPSLDKSSSSIKNTDKKDCKTVARKSSTSSKKRSKESSPYIDETQQPAVFSIDILPCTDNLVDKTLKENARSLQETDQVENVREKKSYTSLAVELGEASEEKFTLNVKNTVVENINKVEPNVTSSFSRKSPKWPETDIKTEDQAWDMLLNEPDKRVSPIPNTGDRSEDSKPRSKRNRKTKKNLEDVQSKSDENSFVEIHAIEEKQQPACDDLVSISSPFEDVDTCTSYVAKIKKSQSSKSLTPEKTYEEEQNAGDLIAKGELVVSNDVEKKMSDVDNLPQLDTAKCTEETKSKTKLNTAIITQSIEVDKKDSNVNIESITTRKSKSLSPYLDIRKPVEIFTDTDVKDVYVIDSTTEEFPEIQITRGSKSRKKSHQVVDNQGVEKQSHVEKSVKSWSSVAASKSVKKVEEKCDVEKNIEAENKNVHRCDKVCEYSDVASGLDESSKGISLHEKLYELCKRRDIMVAECDVPSELNFVEEHHSVSHDLPPLEPLDFGLDDFKLGVMRDSLLDVNETKLTSPICKINIDDILSSLKETTTKAIESSTFNLIELEKVPAKKEKGFSVIENQKIISQEIKIDDDFRTNEHEAEIMEKSSDDDNASPVISTDSDKDDKKGESSKIAIPAVKQPAKVKKSRRKKK